MKGWLFLLFVIVLMVGVRIVSEVYPWGILTLFPAGAIILFFGEKMKKEYDDDWNRKE